MKRPVRKLRLAAETVRELRPLQLAVVHGGINSDYTECIKSCSESL